MITTPGSELYLGFIPTIMRTVIGVILLLGGMGLCLFDAVTSGFARAYSIKLYYQQIAALPKQQTYTRAEYTSAAWQTWTNRVNLPPKESYTADELMNGLFGLGTSQNSCDRSTFEALIADASGHRRNTGIGTSKIGIFTMLVGAFLLGGAILPMTKRIKDANT